MCHRQNRIYDGFDFDINKQFTGGIVLGTFLSLSINYKTQKIRKKQIDHHFPSVRKSDQNQLWPLITNRSHLSRSQVTTCNCLAALMCHMRVDLQSPHFWGHSWSWQGLSGSVVFGTSLNLLPRHFPWFHWTLRPGFINKVLSRAPSCWLDHASIPLVVWGLLLPETVALALLDWVAIST